MLKKLVLTFITIFLSPIMLHGMEIDTPPAELVTCITTEPISLKARALVQAMRANHDINHLPEELKEAASLAQHAFTEFMIDPEIDESINFFITRCIEPAVRFSDVYKFGRRLFNELPPAIQANVIVNINGECSRLRNMKKVDSPFAKEIELTIKGLEFVKQIYLNGLRSSYLGQLLDNPLALETFIHFTHLGAQQRVKDFLFVFALFHERFDVADYLLRCGSNPSGRLSHRYLALAMAIESKDFCKATFLLSRGANANDEKPVYHREHNGEVKLIGNFSMLELAQQQLVSPEFFELLLKYGANAKKGFFEKDRNSVLVNAIVFGFNPTYLHMIMRHTQFTQPEQQQLLTFARFHARKNYEFLKEFFGDQSDD